MGVWGFSPLLIIFLYSNLITMTEKDLFNYLDGYNFFDNLELLGAIEQYFREYVEKNESFTPSYGELAYYGELADKYKEKKKINRF